MIKSFRKCLSLNLVNYKGWRTSRKIIVFESDDWGSIRMPSRSVYEFLLKKGIPLYKSPYNRYDALESESDLTGLFEVLFKYRDKNSNHPVFTANTVMANPDFERIKKSGFENYHYELFTDTYNKYPDHSESLNLLKFGNKNKIFHPQFHGREHLNVSLWLNLLQKNDKIYRLAFKHNFWGLSKDILPEMKRSIQASFDFKTIDEFPFLEESLIEGLNIFEQIFGYRSESFIANNFIWHPSLHKTLAENGIKYFQGMKYQKKPISEYGRKREMIRHYLGEINEFGQIFLIRNCVFEPSMKQWREKSVDECLKSIQNAFFWHKPAIISTHRLNYIGYIEQSNRDKNLKLLDELLKKILDKWPDAEFITSDKLGNIIKNSYENL